MELHYLWIEHFRSLRKTDICFSARFIIYLIEENDVYKLMIRYNPDFIPDFFRRDNISNVTAIVGQNGTGKSTVLEYIKHHLPSGMITTVNNDIIVYTESDSIGIVKYPAQMKLKLDDQTGLFQEFPYENTDIDAESIKFDMKLSDIDYISYSFILDFKSEPMGYSGLNNISTTALLSEHRQEQNQKFDFATDLEILTKTEISKAIQLFVSEYPYELPFKKPEELLILISEDEINQYVSRPEEYRLGKVQAQVGEYFNDLRARSSKDSDRQQLVNKFYMAALANFLYTQHTYANNFPQIDIHLIRDAGVRDNIRKFIMEYPVSQEFEGDIFQSSQLSKKKEYLLSFLELLESLLHNGKINIVETTSKERFLSFPLNNELDREFRDFMGLYLQSKGLTAYLDFSWRGLSTGQQSWLSLLSRLNHVRFHQTGSDLKKNVIILIDEGDAGFHPEWQRKFFSHTLAFISSILKDFKVQLIMTTNTPFLTSDLPTPYVLFFRHNEDGSIEVLKKDEPMDNTFGANIHDLFIKSFYLNGVVMGDFAKQRIQDIIDFLNDPLMLEPREDYRMTIQQIGEPLLRRKLMDMWSQKFSDDEEERMLRIRLAEIEKRKSKGGNNG
jgi:AAA15 family ATPase/GTPase